MPEPLTATLENTHSREAKSRLLEDIGRLLETSAAPPVFFAKFLQRAVTATQVAGGAIWTRSADGRFDLEHAINWSALRLENAADGIACHGEVLQVASQRERALWVPPQSGAKTVDQNRHAANRSDHGLLLAPIIVDHQVVGLLEVWVTPIPETPHRRDLARLLTELTGFLAAYHHKRQYQSLAQQQKLWQQLDTFVRQIHGSLDPQIVAQWLAQEGRRLLECDQVSVAYAWGAKTKLAAVSGAAVVEPNSRLVQRLQSLCAAVLHSGESLIYQGQRDETLPPVVAQALDTYLGESNCKTLVVLPLSKDGPAFATLTAESFEPTFSAEQLLQRLQTLAPHASCGSGQRSRNLANAAAAGFAPTRPGPRLGQRAHA